MDIPMLRKHLAAVLAVGVLLLAGCSASRPTAGTSSSMPMASASASAPVTAPAAPVSGNQVNIDGFRSKDGSNTCNARSVKLPSGKSVFAGSAEDGGPNKRQ